MKKLLLALVPAMMFASVSVEASAAEITAAEPYEYGKARDISSKEGDHWATPLEINLASPLQVPWYVRDVWGIRLNLIYGRSQNVYGIDVGLVGLNNADMAGVEIEGFNWIGGSQYGLGVGAIGNVVMKHAYGLQIGGIINRFVDESAGVALGLLDFTIGYTGVQIGALTWDAANMEGLQLGVANVARKDLSGAQVGAVNYVNGNMTGAQVGVINTVGGIASGVQIGAFNAAQNLTGVQIGILNINAESKWPMMVLVNANF